MREPNRGDYLTFVVGQGISALGSSFTAFAVPLVIYQLTASPTTLALSFAAGRLPYLVVGLLSGAYADRTDRKRLMIVTHLLMAVVVASVPLLYALQALPLWWLYATSFLLSALKILSDAAAAAVVPSLVARDELAAANGRLIAAFTTASLAGPPLAGVVASLVPVISVLLLDAFSFLVAALSLVLIRNSFNAAAVTAGPARRGVGQEIGEGLSYIWTRPVLRSLALALALVNLVASVGQAELVLFAKERLGATDLQYGLLQAGTAVGVILLSLTAGPVRRRVAYGPAAVGALTLAGLAATAFALASSFWVGLGLWSLRAGLMALSDINVISLRQAIVPDHLLGRVVSFTRVVGQSTAPLGAMLGAALIERADVTTAYLAAGVLTLLAGGLLAFSPLVRADHKPDERPQ
jgi:MFS family permease